MDFIRTAEPSTKVLVAAHALCPGSAKLEVPSRNGAFLLAPHSFLFPYQVLSMGMVLFLVLLLQIAVVVGVLSFLEYQ